MPSAELLVLGWRMRFRPNVVESLERSGVVLLIVNDRPLEPVPTFATAVHVIPGLFEPGYDDDRAVAALAANAGCQGILTFDDELCLIAALASRRAGLPGPPPDAVRTALGKAASRAALRREGVPSTGFAVLGAGEGTSVSAAFSYPFVVKPGALSGGQGVYLVDDETQAAEAIRRCRSLAIEGPVERDQVLVEEYVDGDNFTVEIVLAGATPHVLGVLDATYGLIDEQGLLRFTMCTYSCPTALPPALRAEVVDVAERAVAACGLADTFVHVELRHSATGFRVIELNPRAAGSYIPEMVLLTEGQDYVGSAVAVAMGAPLPAPLPVAAPFAAMAYVPLPTEPYVDGDRVRVHLAETGTPPAAVLRRRVYVQEGGELDRGLPCAGSVLVVGASPPEAGARAALEAGAFTVSYETLTGDA